MPAEPTKPNQAGQKIGSVLEKNPDGTIKRPPAAPAQKPAVSKAAAGDGGQAPTSAAGPAAAASPAGAKTGRQRSGRLALIVALIFALLLAASAAYFYKGRLLAFGRSEWRLVAGNFSKLFGKTKSDQAACSAEVKVCPDGTVVKRKPPKCQFDPCPELKKPANQQIVFSGNLAFLRDAKRMADMNRIKQALKDYYQDWGAYPKQLVFGGRLAKSGKIYLVKVPSDPRPEGQGYQYRSFSPSAYALFFYLEEGRGDLPKGKAVMSPAGIFEARDTDDDGLDDAEENQYGTDLYSVDTDHDGYGDLDELKQGYNPLGAGQLKNLAK